MNSDDRDVAADKRIEKAKAAVGAAKDKAASETSRAMHEAQDTAGQAGGVVGDIYGRAKDHVAALSDKLPDSASDAYEAGHRAVAQGADTVSARVVKQPIEALLLAGAIGYLVGWASGRG